MERSNEEIEKIMEKRINKDNNRIEYLVKQKNFDDEDNEWLSEDKFDDVKIITEYNEKMFRNEQVEQFKPIEKKKRGRKPKVLPPITPISLIASLCYIFSLFATIRAENITYEIDGNQIIVFGWIQILTDQG